MKKMLALGIELLMLLLLFTLSACAGQPRDGNTSPLSGQTASGAGVESGEEPAAPSWKADETVQQESSQPSSKGEGAGLPEPSPPPASNAANQGLVASPSPSDDTAGNHEDLPHSNIGTATDPTLPQTSPHPGNTDSHRQERPDETPPAEEPPQEGAEMKLQVQVGGATFTATLESNVAVDAFVEMMDETPLVLEMSDYAGFEKVGSLGTSLPASNSQTTTHPGDIVLYNGNQIVIFYGSNSWSYTRLARIDDLTGWEDALGSGDVTVAFSIGG